ncbi:hypothetical protein TrVE_jg8570 [Triparma verrucosa]|uniref:N-acetyltransferase domain-containing protein n=1 Tax=Triparma verrucosa TaxID=1606542 RepID=A0A9W7FG22_9STRA|nr:hypothetical protein TrVE_jg8570 [Triparma verrucosa]
MTIIIYSVTFEDDEDSNLAAKAKVLFRGYCDELNDEHGCDLSFQSFQAELDSLPGKFAFSKKGGLWVAGYEDDGEDDEVVTVAPGGMLPGGKPAEASSIVGVVALKLIEGDSVGEVKRMFVNKEGRRKGIGEALVRVLLEYAKGKHYSEIKLDSLERLGAALALYEKFGFKRCEKYVECPEADHVCMSLKLAAEATG